ncbi:hypothetical protein ADEAN_000017300 [Angomonas deanei]|uniref:SRP9 domain-containing protein n=1 Tax=Angomonas deanei TaxID=59799 RepID=A0A7G2C0Q2_9TRYP|nr:hypothetical protein ADEAN_000017300 [Angomonas deanei]
MQARRAGVTRTRLQIKVRPQEKRGHKVVVLRSTDGTSTLTTSLSNYGQLSALESFVQEFVSACTAGVTAPEAKAATTSNNNMNNNNQPNAAAEENNEKQGNKNSQGKGNNNNNNQSKGGKKKGKR